MEEITIIEIRFLRCQVTQKLHRKGMRCNKERGKSDKYPEHKKDGLRSLQQLAGVFLWDAVCGCNVAVWHHQRQCEVPHAEPHSDALYSKKKVELTEE